MPLPLKLLARLPKAQKRDQISDTYICVRSERFPKAEGEEQELVNPGTYGKAFALYLQDKLKSMGYDAPSVLCEDWGWWVEISGLGFSLGLCVYAREDDAGQLREFVCCSSVSEKRKFVWTKLRTVDCELAVRLLMDRIDAALRREQGVQFISVGPANSHCDTRRLTRYC
jgi:hypothetical protein